MKYYSPVTINNLTIIQEKVFELFPKELLGKSSLFYIENNFEQFMSIPELKTELDQLGWTQYVRSFGFLILYKTQHEPTCHIDSGVSQYSFNIPIKNCENTHVNFYTSNKDPIAKSLPNGVTFYDCDPKDCVLVDQLEMTTPHVIQIKKIHAVTNQNEEPRITLLIRLQPSLNLNHLFI